MKLIFYFFIMSFEFILVLLIFAVHLIKDSEFTECFLFLLDKIDVIRVLEYLNMISLIFCSFFIQMFI